MLSRVNSTSSIPVQKKSAKDIYMEGKQKMFSLNKNRLRNEISVESSVCDPKSRPGTSQSQNHSRPPSAEYGGRSKYKIH
jgi:hypothetical protein